MDVDKLRGEVRLSRPPLPADVEPGEIVVIATATAGRKSHSGRPCNKECCMIGELEDPKEEKAQPGSTKNEERQVAVYKTAGRGCDRTHAETCAPSGDPLTFEWIRDAAHANGRQRIWDSLTLCNHFVSDISHKVDWLVSGEYNKTRVFCCS